MCAEAAPRVAPPSLHLLALLCSWKALTPKGLARPPLPSCRSMWPGLASSLRLLGVLALGDSAASCTAWRWNCWGPGSHKQ